MLLVPSIAEQWKAGVKDEMGNVCTFDWMGSVFFFMTVYRIHLSQLLSHCYRSKTPSRLDRL